MQGAQKPVGILVLAAFAFVAGSVVCIASGQPTMMTDCGDHMNSSVMCPFMSASIPTITAASFGKTIVLVLALVLIYATFAATATDERREPILLSRYRYGPEGFSASFLNSTLQLISRGVLHSRVFGL